MLLHRCREQRTHSSINSCMVFSEYWMEVVPTIGTCPVAKQPLYILGSPMAMEMRERRRRTESYDTETTKRALDHDILHSRVTPASVYLIYTM